ncbi:hypothetical protein LXL04_004724 [Taraxacum kok-saghyz]
MSPPATSVITQKPKLPLSLLSPCTTQPIIKNSEPLQVDLEYAYLALKCLTVEAGDEKEVPSSCIADLKKEKNNEKGFFVICYEFCKLQTHIFIDTYSAIDVNRPCYVDVDEDVLPQS